MLNLVKESYGLFYLMKQKVLGIEG